jgi:hypothetical protein
MTRNFTKTDLDNGKAVETYLLRQLDGIRIGKNIADNSSLIDESFRFAWKICRLAIDTGRENLII